MKDLEKIKSEDLGCQVADANPGNFAIEQEVAQLVGATVPAPTEPSADDARELGAQLLVFLRRALLPIRSALRTAVAAIYAHLDSRCTDYTPAAYDPFRAPLGPYDPMRPFVPRTLPNLLTALTAFSARKISEPNAIDGISLAQILCSAYHPTELADDNIDWAMTKTLPWSNLVKVRLGCSTINNTRIMSFSSLTSLKMDELVTANYGSSTDTYTLNGIIYNLAACTEVSFNKLESVSVGGYGSFISALPLITKITFPALKEWKGTWSGGIVANMDGLEELYCPSLILAQGGGGGRENFACYCPKLWKVVVGYGAFTYDSTTYNFSSCPNLIHLEFEHEVTASQVLRGWNPTNALDASRTDLIEEGSTAENNLQQFLVNFKTYIALRLTDNGTGLTLTLSQAVRNAIHAAESTYGIENIIVTQKGWTISPAPGASSQ